MPALPIWGNTLPNTQKGHFLEENPGSKHKVSLFQKNLANHSLTSFCGSNPETSQHTKTVQETTESGMQVIKIA